LLRKDGSLLISAGRVNGETNRSVLALLDRTGKVLKAIPFNLPDCIWMAQTDDGHFAVTCAKIPLPSGLGDTYFFNPGGEKLGIYHGSSGFGPGLTSDSKGRFLVGDKGNLVFLSREGKVIKTVPIATEISAIRLFPSGEIAVSAVLKKETE